MKITLKELRETFTGIRILQKVPDIQYRDELEVLKDENNELLSIFVASVKTAQKNYLNER